MNVPAARVDNQIAMSIQIQALRAVHLEPNLIGVGPRRDDKIKFQLPLIPVIDRMIPGYTCGCVTLAKVGTFVRHFSGSLPMK